MPCPIELLSEIILATEQSIEFEDLSGTGIASDPGQR
jgi:hypothetical protein